MGALLPRFELVMAYFCYIHRQSGGVPHFEVLPETSPGHAIDTAARLLVQRADAVRAEVWEDERLVFTLPRGVVAPRAPLAT
jgi:hypothetical protein